jgi:RNA-directed DNA polymerase
MASARVGALTPRSLKATEHLKAGYQTLVDLDLSKFFDRVHHQRLLDRIARRVSDQRLLAVVRQMLRAGVVMPDGTKVVVQEGTPQGGPLSPLLFNIVLDELDSELAAASYRTKLHDGKFQGALFC